MYTFHYATKNWRDADLSCKAHGKHLVSFESVEQYDHVFEPIQKYCSDLGFWTSARELESNIWIWRNTGHFVIDDIWSPVHPDGDGDCGHMQQSQPGYPLNDLPCDTEMCYICESP